MLLTVAESCGLFFLGTNWTAEIVKNILYVRDEEALNLWSNLPVQLVFFEGGGREYFFKMLGNSWE